MSTANFKSMEYGMPMVCGGMNEDEFDNMIEYERAEYLAENFTADLQFHDISIECGHYQGFQFYVEEKYSGYFDLDKESKCCIDNEDAHYYFDMCRSKAIRAADAEKRKINKWLENLENDGFVILVCAVRFSNGEAYYSIRNNRTRLMSAVNGN